MSATATTGARNITVSGKVSQASFDRLKAIADRLGIGHCSLIGLICEATAQSDNLCTACRNNKETRNQ